jgi:hypothetical protein
VLLRIVYTTQLTWHRSMVFSGSTEYDETAQVAEMYLDKTSASDFRQWRGLTCALESTFNEKPEIF